MSSILNNPLVKKAAQFAKEKHKYQKRRTGEPYFTHPQAVARSVSKWTRDPNVVAAAYLHDVIEDTGCDYEDLLERFGKKVARYVSLVSRDFRKSKAASLREFRSQLRRAPPEVKLIVAADLMNNAISKVDRAFMKIWFKKTSKTIPAVMHGNLGKYRKAIKTFIRQVRQEMETFPR